MARLFRILDRTARRWPLAGLLVVILGFRFGMQATLERLKAVSGESILDYEIFYSRERVLEVFRNYGEEGAALYRRFMTYDLAFPLLYGLFFAGLIHLVLARTRYRWLALAPLVMALLDYIENAFFYLFLTSYPDISGTLVVLANGFSLGKYGLGAVSAVVGVGAAVVFVRARMRR